MMLDWIFWIRMIGWMNYCLLFCFMMNLGVSLFWLVVVVVVKYVCWFGFWWCWFCLGYWLYRWSGFSLIGCLLFWSYGFFMRRGVILLVVNWSCLLMLMLFKVGNWWFVLILRIVVSWWLMLWLLIGLILSNFFLLLYWFFLIWMVMWWFRVYLCWMNFWLERVRNLVLCWKIC